MKPTLDNLDETRALAIANHTILAALTWQLTKNGSVNGQTLDTSLSHAADAFSQKDPRLARVLREFLTLYPVAFSDGSTPGVPSWFRGVVQGGHSGETDTRETPSSGEPDGDERD